MRKVKIINKNSCKEVIHYFSSESDVEKYLSQSTEEDIVDDVLIVD
jgi:hypothetical protein